MRSNISQSVLSGIGSIAQAARDAHRTAALAGKTAAQIRAHTNTQVARNMAARENVGRDIMKNAGDLSQQQTEQLGRTIQTAYGADLTDKEIRREAAKFGTGGASEFQAQNRMVREQNMRSAAESFLSGARQRNAGVEAATNIPLGLQAVQAFTQDRMNGRPSGLVDTAGNPLMVGGEQ